MKPFRETMQRQIKIFLPKYIHHRNHVSKGSNELAFLRQPVQVVLLAKIAYKNIPTYALVGLVIAYLIGCKAFGWLWDKNKGYDFEAEWGNIRNPTIKYIKRKV